MGWGESSTELRIHSVHCHVWDTIVILEEGNRPRPLCTSCDMFVPWGVLNGRHTTMVLYRRGEERKRRLLAAKEVWTRADTAFKVHIQPLTMLLYFK